MDIVFLGIVIFLFVLAIFDLSVGVSNDAVNFLNSAIGAKAASFRTIIIVAAVGVFLGAAMSNGMMEIARHGIFQPERFYFYELMCLFTAVMVTDILLLDVFNSLGMPTSTTVSMVFEMLGATFALSIYKIATDATGELNFGNLLNTDKALSVILGIFCSVAIAFFFGALVQYIARLIFSFNYRCRLKYKIGIFGGIAATAIIYFLLLKGAKDAAFMTKDVKAWIHDNTGLIVIGCFVFFTILMQILHWCRVNVLKVVVLMGTFALAMAFAGNDLVNFIGVPLAGFSSYQDYMAAGASEPMGFLMDSLNGPARSPIFFLLAAGAIMVFSLATSKKAYNVVKTSVSLSAQSEGDEMFGSSKLARSLVRGFASIANWVVYITPARVKRWVGSRFNVEESIMEDGAAFDLLRASINLVLAGLLIAVGTSLKLPLSTTYVTFMVAMGTSLADMAWGRESAVFRITGVLSVIGGWFITAFAAFISCGIVVMLMFFGGTPAIIAIVIIAVVVLVRSNLRYRNKVKEDKQDTLFYRMMSTDDNAELWSLFRQHVAQEQRSYLDFAIRTYDQITDGFINESIRPMTKAERAIRHKKGQLKNVRRKEVACFRRLDRELALEKNTWYHLGMNSVVGINYNLHRICEFCREHVDNNFMPLQPQYAEEFVGLRERIVELMNRGIGILEKGNYEEAVPTLRAELETLKDELSARSKAVFDHIQDEESTNLTVTYVYLNMLQESQEMVSLYRHMLRADRKLNYMGGEPDPTIDAE